MNASLTASTPSSATIMRRFNDYWVYGNAIGGGIVNTFNVRSFLVDPSNSIISNDFRAYLTANTTTDEFVQIIGDNEQLSSMFNEFYETTVINGLSMTNDVISNNASTTQTISFMSVDHLWNGGTEYSDLSNIPSSITGETHDNRITNVVSRFSDDDSYYVPVFIKRETGENGKTKYDLCQDRISPFLNPDEFPAQGISVENEIGPAPNIITIRNDVERQADIVFNIEHLNSRADHLISKCYGSECIENKYCDILFFAKRRMLEINAINTDYIQQLLGGRTVGLTDQDIVSALRTEAGRNGHTILNDALPCLVDISLIRTIQ